MWSLGKTLDNYLFHDGEKHNYTCIYGLEKSVIEPLVNTVEGYTSLIKYYADELIILLYYICYFIF